MEITILENENGQRIDRFLRKFFKKYNEVKLSHIYKWLRIGLIKLNGKKTSQEKIIYLNDKIFLDEKIQFGDTNILDLDDKSKKFNQLGIEKLKKLILFEDTNFIFFDKPAGIVIHGGNKHIDDLNLNDYLEKYLQLTNFKNNSKTFKPAFGFRLDKDTSGIIVGAKNFKALQYLNGIIKERQVDKYYLCVVLGKFPLKKIIEKPLERGFNKQFGRAQTQVSKDGKPSSTLCENILTIENKYIGNISLLKVKLLTGRMHQIRAHLSSEKFPILGDLLYGKESVNRILNEKMKINRQLLHSYMYGFFDKFNNKKINIKSNIPDDFKNLFGENLKI